MAVTYFCNNKGDLVPPHPDMAHPVAGTGQTKSIALANTNYTVTVEAGSSYRVVSGSGGLDNDGWVWFSITGDVTTDANKEYTLSLGESAIIKIPVGATTLNIGSSLASTMVYLVKVRDV